MKYLITEHQNKLLMVQNVIDNCLNELRDWCDSISEYGNDEADSICYALSFELICLTQTHLLYFPYFLYF
jgi:3-oxoacyl-[acyl-carrier-protein] synthase III